MSGRELITQPSDRAARGRAGRGLSLAGLALRQLALRPGWTAFLALGLAMAFALTTAFAVSATMAADAALHTAVTAPGDQARLTVAQRRVGDQSAFESAEAGLSAQVEGRIGPYLSSSSAMATLGPLRLVALNENPAPAQFDTSGLAVGYLRDLPDHVELLAGGVPPDGLGGSSDVAATMAQPEADALGLHLGDRVCLEFAGAGTRWCARVAGLWRPLQGGDPFRLEAGRQVQLVVGRYDFYRLMKLAGSPLATVGRQFHVAVEALNSGNAAALVGGLRDLRAYFGARGELFDTSLDRVIEDLYARQHAVHVTSELLAAALGGLVLYAAAFGVGHVLGLQRREVSLVRARGWPRRRVKRLLMLQVAALMVASLLLGCGVAAVAANVLGRALFGVPPPWSELSETRQVVAPLLAAAGGLALLWTVLSGVAARTARGALTLSAGAAAEPPPAVRRDRRAVVWALLASGFALLGAVRLSQGLSPLPGPSWSGTGSGTLDWPVAVTALLAVLLLAAAAARVLPLAGVAAAGSGSGVPASLARWQLQRRPRQHGQLAFVLTLAVALAAFAGPAAASGEGRGPDLPAAGVLLGGGLAAVLVAVFAFALHFRVVAGERAEEYAALLLSGLPRRALRRSVALEQRAVTWQCLASGPLIGVALALALLPLGNLTRSAAMSVATPAVLLLGFLFAMLAAGWAVRARLGRHHPGDQLRVLT
jgi:FtsX-like permease family